MPELPEVEALAHHLREHALYRPVARVDVASMSAIKTFDPPVQALVGRVVTGAARYGKFLAVEFLDRPDDPLHLITHLSRAGWLRWHDTAAVTPPKPGKGPLEFRLHLDEVGGPGFDLTEAGTQKRLAIYLVADPPQVPGIARLGPDALAVTREEFAELLGGHTERIKTLIVDQAWLAGVGNAYSDEILHTARLSPYAVAGRLKPEQVDVLYDALRSVLTDAVERSVGQGAASAQGGEALRTAGARPHRAALPGLRGDRAGGLVRQPVVPVLSGLPDRWQTPRRPAAFPTGPVGAQMNDLLSSPTTLLLLIGLVFLTGGVAIFYFLRNRRNTFATPLERATFGTLHTVALAAPSLREGLSPSSASFALPYLRQLLDTCALTMTDNRGNTLALGRRRRPARARRALAGRAGDLHRAAADAVALGDRLRAPRLRGARHRRGAAGDRRLDHRHARRAHHVHRGPGAPAGHRRSRALRVVSQLELAELDESRARLNRAEVRALRAQISPHFVYNALTTIASFIRTDPVRARELLIEFADFTRYSFRTAGEYTTLQDELTNIERYVRLEKARFGNRLNIKLQIAPEVLSVVLPFLALQPLVENAVRHGLASKPNGGTITITAENAGNECVIIVEDDGVGMDPARLHEDLADAHLSGRARRAGQRRRPDALHVRRRLRPGRRHRDRPGHEDHPAGAEVPGGHPGLSPALVNGAAGGGCR